MGEIGEVGEMGKVGIEASILSRKSATCAICGGKLIRADTQVCPYNSKFKIHCQLSIVNYPLSIVN